MELVEKDAREIFHENFCKIDNFIKQRIDFMVSQPNSWKSFSEDVSLIAPVIAMVALHWINSRLLWIDSLKPRL